MAKKKSKRASKKKSASEPPLVVRALRRVGATLSSLAVGREVDEETSGVLQEIKGLLFIGFALWLGLSAVSFFEPLTDPRAEDYNYGGAIGFYLARWALYTVGWSSYLLCFLGLAWGVVLMSGRHVHFPWVRVFGGVCLLFAAAVLFELAFGTGYAERTGELRSIGAATGHRLQFGPGGWLAEQLVRGVPEHGVETGVLVENFGLLGAWIIALLVTVASFMLATELAFVPAMAAFAHWLGERRSTRGESTLAALFTWTRATLVSWWEFLRGSDVELAPMPPKSRAAKKSTAKKSTTKTSKKPAKQTEPELAFADEAEDEEVWDDEEEWEEDEAAEPVAEDDGEWEYADADEPWDEGEQGADEEWEYEDEEDDGEYEDDEEWEDVDEAAELEPAKPSKSNAELIKKKLAFKAPEPKAYDPPTPPKGPWKFPPLDLLIAPDPTRGSGRTQADIESEAKRLEQQLASFRVEAQVVGSVVGPVVTLYELEVAQGTRLNKVTQLSNEIAAALRAKSIRVIAPIPGRSTVGVEVPNGKRSLVRFSELITKEAYDPKHYALPMFLGMDAEGNPVVEDLARMPHLLIAGQTGSGKSVCINTIIASLLMTRSPHDVQTIMVDPKMVELQMFSQIPHQMCPVVTDMKYAANVLEWACEKMEMRYELFKNAGVRNIKGYNSLGEKKLAERMGENWSDERTPRHVPYIVVIIDEMADLMMTSKKEAEGAITRLAQKSRAVGIHVIVATQRPSTNVITGVLKGNLPTRIAFTVASNQDSRVILDKAGAEKLLGQGDMLYTPPASSLTTRAQGALVEDGELQNIVDYVCEESAPSFNQELVQVATGATRGDGDGAGVDPAAEDELWDQAVRAVLSTRRGSASMLQRHLKVGYTRASRLIDMMGEVGIVGEHKGSKSREIMLTLEEWEEMNGVASGAADDQ